MEDSVLWHVLGRKGSDINPDGVVGSFKRVVKNDQDRVKNNSSPGYFRPTPLLDSRHLLFLVTVCCPHPI